VKGRKKMMCNQTKRDKKINEGKTEKADKKNENKKKSEEETKKKKGRKKKQRE
jgi:hypothetical protein